MSQHAPHVVARRSPYLNGPERQPLKDEEVPWTVACPSYNPPSYTADVVAKQPVWADNPAQLPSMKFNTVDGKIDRRSFEGEYSLDPATGMPINPRGRTGLTGRGLLGRFGPNHAADPIVTRWKRYKNKQIVLDEKGHKVLEFVAIKRKDTGEWAIPGGMVEVGDTVSATLKKEFGEEALNSLECSPEEAKKLHERLDAMFKHGVDVYRGYVDDPRNTDNAWMETVAVNFHDHDGTTFDNFDLHAGDDAAQVAWTTYSDETRLYASHRKFIETVYNRLVLDPKQHSLVPLAKSTSTFED